MSKWTFVIPTSHMIYERVCKIEPDQFLSEVWALSILKKMSYKANNLQTKRLLKLNINLP